MSRLARLLALALLLAAPAAAQLPTPPYENSTAGHLPFPTVTLLSAQTTTTTGTDPVWIGHWPNPAVQVTVGTCGGSYSLKFQGIIDGSVWDDIEVNGGSAAITQATVAANATQVWAVPPGYRFIRAVVTAISSCSVNAYLSRNPG